MTNTIAKRQNGRDYTATFGNVVDNLLQTSLDRFFDNNFWDVENQLTGTVPVNIRETEQQYELDVIAPGCRKEDFNINVVDNVLTIVLNQKEETNHEAGKKGWVRNEFVQRSFSRSFTLDDTVDLNNISAVYTDGILRLALGKMKRQKTYLKT